ncbi:eukaryotic translation initiation factor 4E binding protein [Radiomyces spectabilis]|uniref:eukaryotic translation initiation factor 4E binding protein n=1 Tax=Radiomyces spectabilis TaxID=64574 RepID=UPI00221F0A41|nr:eukaryotic translation initiation factor 4E binding protein [Radiomyces spectabilis]KAI8368309.1 eukaryotic translation initiation factor 4E binding protein [Radiomyces spectabilis]
MSTAAPVNIRLAAPDASLPSEYSTTPHGTIYSSTPGGTRVIYDRDTLLALANSELAQTPPSKMAFVAGVTRPNADHPAFRKTVEQKKKEEAKKQTFNPFALLNDDDDGMFDMDE